MKNLTKKEQNIAKTRAFFSHLRAYADGKFREHWQNELVNMRNFTEETPCGTTHCFLGWLANDEAWAKDLLYYPPGFKDEDSTKYHSPYKFLAANLSSFSDELFDYADGIFAPVWAPIQSGNPDDIISRLNQAEMEIIRYLETYA